MPDRQLGRGFSDGAEVGGDDPGRLRELDCHRSVVQVLACHPKVDVSRLRLTDGFVDDGQKSNHVMSDSALDLRDLVRVESRLPDLGQR
jgi:hypothetical protein